jgi:hypothetical protein
MVEMFMLPDLGFKPQMDHRRHGVIFTRPCPPCKRRQIFLLPFPVFRDKVTHLFHENPYPFSKPLIQTASHENSGSGNHRIEGEKIGGIHGD